MEYFSIHPATEKMIRAGHPWVTSDRFSSQFPKKFGLIGLLDKNKNHFAIAINDPQHSNIKARLWSNDPKELSIDFNQLLRTRIVAALKKRDELIKLGQRDNVYLTFGEADRLPGLFVLQLDQVILIQYYSHFWIEHLAEIEKIYRSILQTEKEYWAQSRGHGQIAPYPLQKNVKTQINYWLQEYGVKYRIHLGASYDHGLYTDMAGIRNKIKNHLPRGGKFLNLYSYTGAWSLFALSQGVKEVVSVDLSKTYLQWLDENLNNNQWPAESSHRSMEMNVEKALQELIKNGETFDFIFCDPPSASSDGEKKTSALKEYAKLIPQFDQLLSVKGKMLIFLNTHSISAGKFGNSIAEYLSISVHAKWSLLGTYGLSEDCPMLKGFPEGNYLKGVLYQKG